MNKQSNFPWLILVIGIAFLILTGWSIYQARRGTSAVTDRDYYSHGLRYNETLLERRAAEALGWSITSELNGKTLTFQLLGKDGNPVIEANGTLNIHLKKSAKSFTFPLLHSSPGVYQINLPDDFTGEMSARLEFEKNGARVSRQLLLNL